MAGRIQKGRGTFDFQGATRDIQSASHRGYGSHFPTQRFPKLFGCDSQNVRFFYAQVGPITPPMNSLNAVRCVESQQSQESAAAGHGARTRFGFFPRSRRRRPAAIGSRAALNRTPL